MGLVFVALRAVGMELAGVRNCQFMKRAGVLRLSAPVVESRPVRWTRIASTQEWVSCIRQE